MDFSDNFDRADSNVVGNGWTEVETTASGCGVYGNVLSLTGSAACYQSDIVSNFDKRVQIDIMNEFDFGAEITGMIVAGNDVTTNSLCVEFNNVLSQLRIIKNGSVIDTITGVFINDSWSHVDINYQAEDLTVKVNGVTQYTGSIPGSGIIHRGSFGCCNNAVLGVNAFFDNLVVNAFFDNLVVTDLFGTEPYSNMKKIRMLLGVGK